MKIFIAFLAVALIFFGGVLFSPDWNPETSTRSLLGLVSLSFGVVILMALLGERHA